MSPKTTIMRRVPVSGRCDTDPWSVWPPLGSSAVTNSPSRSTTTHVEACCRGQVFHPGETKAPQPVQAPIKRDESSSSTELNAEAQLLECEEDESYRRVGRAAGGEKALQSVHGCR